MRKRPERAGRISIQTLTISPMISDVDWLREPDFDLRPAVTERSPRAVICNPIKLVAGAGFEPTTFGL